MVTGRGISGRSLFNCEHLKDLLQKELNEFKVLRHKFTLQVHYDYASLQTRVYLRFEDEVAGFAIDDLFCGEIRERHDRRRETARVVARSLVDQLGEDKGHLHFAKRTYRFRFLEQRPPHPPDRNGIVWFYR